MKPESGRVFGLDVMRASAISLVLLNHFAFFFPARRSFFYFGLFAGHYGVELFFVLSGFLIGGILLRTLTNERSTSTLTDFWLRRWFRTLPNYFLFLILNIDLAWWLGSGTPSLWKYPFFLQNLTDHPPPFFAESWSLAVEEWFYLITPILFFIALKIAPRKFRLSSLFIIIASIAVVTVARGIFVAVTHPVWLTGVRMIVIYRLDACMFGVFAAWIKYFHPEIFHQRRHLFFATGILLFAFVILYPFTLPGDSVFFHNIGFTLTSLGAMMLLPLLDSWTSGGRGTGIIVKISLWSYSLYLVNLPLRYLLPRLASGLPAPILAVTFLFLSILIAAFIYTTFEKPIMDVRKGSLLRARDSAEQPRDLDRKNLTE